MIVFDLDCQHGHRFEGWFGSSADYEQQLERGLIACPHCGDAAVRKAPMAPAIGAKSNQSAFVPAAMEEACERAKDESAVGGPSANRGAGGSAQSNEPSAPGTHTGLGTHTGREVGATTRPNAGRDRITDSDPDRRDGPPMASGAIPPAVQAAMQALAAAQAEAIKSSKWVGDDLANQSRAMHYGERKLEAIHGKATLEEAKDLIEEGVPIAPLLCPVVEPDKLN